MRRLRSFNYPSIWEHGSRCGTRELSITSVLIDAANVDSEQIAWVKGILARAGVTSSEAVRILAKDVAYRFPRGFDPGFSLRTDPQGG
jgi:hypothetical protein